MAKRGGPSISVKMILTTTLLIVVTVVGSGFLNVVNIRRAFDASVADRIKTFKEGREQLGLAGTQGIARGVTPFLIDKHDDEIEQLIRLSVAQDNRTDDKGHIDYGLKMAYVLDLNQKVILHCIEKAIHDRSDFGLQLGHGHRAEHFGNRAADARMLRRIGINDA